MAIPMLRLPLALASKQLPQRSSLFGGLMIGGMTALSALVSRRLAPTPTKGLTRVWYDTLQKPSFTPPKKIYGPVWAGLYVTTAVAAWRVWQAYPSPQRSKALGLWVSHLGFNAAWSQLFFGQHKARASLVDITMDLSASAAFTAYAAKTDRLAGLLAAPLTVWLALGTAVNEEILRKNRSLLR